MTLIRLILAFITRADLRQFMADMLRYAEPFSGCPCPSCGRPMWRRYDFFIDAADGRVGRVDRPGFAESFHCEPCCEDH